MKKVHLAEENPGQNYGCYCSKRVKVIRPMVWKLEVCALRPWVLALRTPGQFFVIWLWNIVPYFHKNGWTSMRSSSLKWCTSGRTCHFLYTRCFWYTNSFLSMKNKIQTLLYGQNSRWLPRWPTKSYAFPIFITMLPKTIIMVSRVR